MCFEWSVNSTSYSVKRFVLGLWCQGIQGLVEGGQVYPAHTVSGPCGEAICLTFKQWWHLSWAIMISPYNENVTYCSMTLCGPPQDDESWGPYVLPKKKKQAFYKEGKMWNLLIKSQPVDRHSFWSSTVLCAMGKYQPGWAWHKQQTHLHNLVEWHKKTNTDNRCGKTRLRHTSFCCHISHMHTCSSKQNQLQGYEFIKDAMVTVCACYKNPSIFAFLEVRCLNERLPGYRPSCTKNKRQNALPKEPTHFK